MRIKEAVAIILLVFLFVHFSTHIVIYAAAKTADNLEQEVVKDSNDDLELKDDNYQESEGLEDEGMIESSKESTDKNVPDSEEDTGSEKTNNDDLEDEGEEEITNDSEVESEQENNMDSHNNDNTVDDMKEIESQVNKKDEITVLEPPLLANGVRHESVIKLKKDLAKLGFPVPGKGTNLFGNQTEKKLQEFQLYYGLIVTGVFDNDSQNKMNAILLSPLQNGNMNKETIQLKKDLSFLGFAVPGKGTNLFGKQTEEQVRSFQAKYNIRVNGIVDEVTLMKIRELLDMPLANGMRREDVKTLKNNLHKVGFVVPGKGTTLFGIQTEKKVKEFQAYYGLEVTGIVYESTIDKMNEILSSSLQYGKRNSATIQLKKDLAVLGFNVPGNGTSLFGKQTEKKVKEFQKYYNLRPNGIVDSVSLAKIKEVLSYPLQNGKKHKDTIALKQNLKRLGFSVPGNNTSLYGKETTKKVKEFQKYYAIHVSGIADKITLRKIDELLASPLQYGKRHKNTIKLKNDLEILGYTVSNKPTTLFGIKTERQVKKFQKTNGLPVSGIADTLTLKKIDSLIIKIHIDPGHGGKDPGAQSRGLNEKDVTLDIALRAAEVLSKKYVGVAVNLSRTTDKFIELTDRAIQANEWGADYFVSIHTNSHRGTAHGFESFIYNGKVSQMTKDKQKELHQYLINKLGVYDRGMKTANFNVLRNTEMPAILFEFLFIDNPKENALLKDKKYRAWLGEITADAIAQSFNLKRR